MVRHILTALDLNGKELWKLFDRARTFKRAPEIPVFSLLGKRVIMLFYEPSTRTRFSFEAAVDRLGARFSATEDAEQFSSFAKGESLEDTVSVCSSYGDAIVLRHKVNGAAEQAARASRVSIINAGDGSNEHPTQAFLDLFTIWEASKSGRFPRGKLRILFYGDNRHSRTVRSLARLLAVHGEDLGLSIAWMKFSGPNESGKISDVLFQELKCTRDMMCWNGTGDPEPEDADIVYVTRPQVERHAEERPPISESARINLAFAVRLPEHAIIMHPLPRTGELSPEVDKDERAWYFKQVENGLHVRMALLEMLLVKN